MKPQFVLRLTSEAEYAKARADGHLSQAPVDVKDGYFHMSTGAQAEETARLYFAGKSDTLILVIDTNELKPAVQWDAVESRGGEEFPHYYAQTLPMVAIKAAFKTFTEVREAYPQVFA
eukprot:EC725328.1.p1 GENE.EC725328.1~~EC725328.1.p1  ORF type:complete len:127 (+),score=12.62 EC725328.1:29-382(+)